LLKTEVLPRHVGEAVVFFASMRTPTTGAVFAVGRGAARGVPAMSGRGSRTDDRAAFAAQDISRRAK
jgi:hypothetical protein